jgi:hypothetical protein
MFTSKNLVYAYNLLKIRHFKIKMNFIHQIINLKYQSLIQFMHTIIYSHLFYSINFG